MTKRLIYILDCFPAVSETFVYNELRMLHEFKKDFFVYIRDRGSENFKRDLAFLGGKTKYLVKRQRIQGLALIANFIKNPIRTIEVMRFYKRNKGFINPEMLNDALEISLKISNPKKNHLHAHFATTPATIAMLVNKVTGVDYTFTAHAYDIFVYQILLEEKLNTAKNVISVCDYNTNWLIDHYPELEKSKIVKVKCGVDVSEFSYQPHPQSGNNKILTVGRLVEKKGFGYLIEACGVLKRQGYSFELTIIGDGPLRENLIKIIKSEGLTKNVKLAGSISDQKLLYKKMQSSDIFILPCIEASNGDRDSMPVVIKEAMAIGVPVIATRAFGIPEMISDNKTGLLVAPRNSGELACAIKRMLKMDERELEIIKRTARDRVEKEFNIKSEVLKLVKVFES